MIDGHRQGCLEQLGIVRARDLPGQRALYALVKQQGKPLQVLADAGLSRA
jgi:hypothetical protein